MLTMKKPLKINKKNAKLDMVCVRISTEKKELLAKKAKKLDKSYTVSDVLNALIEGFLNDRIVSK